MNIKPIISFRKILFLMILFLGVILAFRAGSLISVHAQNGGNDYFNVKTFLSNGISIDEYIINGPPTPPPGYELERAAVDLTESVQQYAIHALTVPAFDWVFGCSSVSGAMIAGYYDRNGFPNIYTGPTDGGVMPLDNSSWPTWSDGSDTYPNLPLAASKNGVDGRSTRGSIDDYWVKYGSSASDPYITGSWTQHTWGEAIGDYMKTSQSAFSNTDGSTTFYTFTGSASQLTCSQMETLTDGGKKLSTLDGTYGRKLFYEARGYTVTDCYNQKTDNNEGGFTLAMYKAEIDAGRPVMLNLKGHTIVGVGYNDASNTIYIHDTWDYLNHEMSWGGSYSGMALESVSIVNLQPSASPPAAFHKTSPANIPVGQFPSLTLRWEASSGATTYQYCIDNVNNSTCDAAWISTAANTSVSLTDLATGSHFWQVRAVNSFGNTEADGGTWWSFTVIQPKKVYLPSVIKPVPLPGGFNKTAPSNGATNQPTNPTLSWTVSSNATSYEYCIDTSNDHICNGTGVWTSTSASTSANLSGLSSTTSYYWQVRARNASGTTEADGGNWRSFTTGISGAPTAGLWESNTGDEFYVTIDQTNVDNFAIYIQVNPCGNYKITNPALVPIINNQFSFTGSFYANGTFDSSTSAHGTDGLNSFYIPDCGYVSGGPWSWTATWKDSTQPTPNLISDEGSSTSIIVLPFPSLNYHMTTNH